MADLTTVQFALGGVSGLLVGIVLGLFGGGGSVLAVPLIVYVVGVPSAHIAIGTSAFAVAVNAALGLANHARHGSVRWTCAAIFSVAGVVGAYAGSSLGKIVDGERLLFLFALVMMGVGALMFRHRNSGGEAGATCTVAKAPKVAGFGLLTGAFSGFFGIGGGFLIVPALLASTGIATLNAVATSLVAVTAFGLTTALNYAQSGLVDWPLAGIFIGGGLIGTLLGERASRLMSRNDSTMRVAFAFLIFAVAIYMALESVLDDV